MVIIYLVEIILLLMIQNVEYKEALKILNQIEEQVDTCCAVTMYPEDVLELISKLRTIIKNGENHENETNGRSSAPKKTKRTRKN